MSTTEHIETVIIGAGQAGLSVGYHLSRQGRPFVILDANKKVGDNWRRHWDSLRLYSPARYDGLPGLPFPAPAWSWPNKDDVAGYLATYARTFDLPVRTGTTVTGLSRPNGRYAVTTADRVLEADNVVVASGTFGRPHTPGFAADLDPAIRQLHSSRYRNPSQLRDGPVLVVGAAHSGADVAYEVARAGHPTVLSGRNTGQLPFRIEGPAGRFALPVIFFTWSHVLTLRTPIGRKLRPEVRAHGGPLVRYRAGDLAGAGVERVFARTAGVRDGKPVLDDGRVLDVTNVVWCTGFRQNFGWIDVPVIGEDGWPHEERGIVTSSPGLYFCGLAFQYAFTSMLVGGIGRDAAHIARHIASRTRRPVAGPAGRGRVPA